MKKFRDFVMTEARISSGNLSSASQKIVNYLSKKMNLEYLSIEEQLYSNTSGNFKGYLYIDKAGKKAVRINWEGTKFHSINFWSDYSKEISPPFEIFTSDVEPSNPTFTRLLPKIAEMIVSGMVESEDYEGDELNENWKYDGRNFNTKTDVVVYMHNLGETLEDIKKVTGLSPSKIKEIISKRGETVEESGVKLVKGSAEVLHDNRGTKEAQKKLDSTKYADPEVVFEELESYLEVLVRGFSTALMITGQGGIGKSFTVTETMEKLGKKRNEDYVVLKGRVTPIGLYSFLFKNYDKICVIDDADSIFETTDGLNLLKGALDSGKDREISWMTKGKNMVDTFGMTSHDDIEFALSEYNAITNKEGIPNYFVFRGSVVFISNLTRSDIEKRDSALLTRCTFVDIILSARDVVKRIKTVLPFIKIYDAKGVNYATEENKQIVFDWISSDEFLEDSRMRGKEVNFRMFNQIYSFYHAGLSNWKELSFRAGG